MSGRKQHFIPQSLLRGFGTQKGKKTYVVAYTHDRGTFTPATDGIGAERSFYSELDVEGGSTTLDDKITDYEQQIPSVLENLRQVSDAIDPVVAAELVTHLAVRNDHFRKSTSAGGADLIAGMTEVLGDEDRARLLLGVAGDDPSEMLAIEIAKVWSQYLPLFNLMGITEKQFNALSFQVMKANFSTFHEELAGPIREAFGGMIEKIPEVTANAQRRALADDLAPPKRIERLSEFQWKTIETTDLLILPDCVAIAFDAEAGILPLMLADLDRTESIWMPLASNRLLIGSMHEGVSSPGNLNELLASCSWDFFVARIRTAELERYRTTLRSRSAKFMSGTVNDVINDALNKGRH